jgi:Domain of unknown function (DUF4159)
VKRILVLVFFVVLARPANSDWTEPAQPEFVFARLACTNRDSWMYWPTYYPDMPPWKHDYPESDEFFISLVHELTGIRVRPNSYKIVQLSSPEIFEYPFLYLSEPGFLRLDEKEIANLGEYIRRGGFVMADDFRTAAYLGGPEELDVLRSYHEFFNVTSLKMTPPYGGFVPEFWGMSDEYGRLQLIANYNNDIGDFWKYLDEGDKPLQDSTTSIRMGINYVVYAMSH